MFSQRLYCLHIELSKKENINLHKSIREGDRVETQTTGTNVLNYSSEPLVKRNGS